MPKIKIYTTATCAYCRAEKAWLEGHNLEFDEVAVDVDPEAAEEMFALSGQLGVPFTVISGESGPPQTILGFDQARLALALGI